VRASKRLIAVALLIFSECFSISAQYQDRDSRAIPRTSESAPPPEARVDINHASLNELLKVPGMTQSWAARIVRYRPYSTKADLLQRGIVPDAVYSRIRDYVIAHREKK
jgi:competence protein ComEA